MHYKSIKLSTISIALASLLTACGGGGSSSPSFQGKTLDGVAIDFYVAGATVKFDDCGTSTTTDTAGKFTFTTTQACQESAITVTGGTDIVTGLPFTGELKSKKVNLQNRTISANAPEVVLSPLTTLEFHAAAANISLDSLLDKLGLSTLKGKDFTIFDPQASATADEMAKIFVLQQIANKITEAGTTEAAFAKIVKALDSSTTGLFSDGKLNLALVTTLANLSIAENLGSLYAILGDVIAQGGNNANLADLIKEKDLVNEIVDLVGVEAYTDILIAGKTLADLKASTAASPINLNLAALNTLLNVGFKPASAATTADSIKIAFKLKGTQGAQTEHLDVLVENVKLSFNNGALTSAVIPAGTKVAVSSSLYNVENIVFTLNNDTNLGTTINLNSLTQSNATLKNYYDRFYSLLNVGAAVEAEAFIQSENFTITSSELNPASTVTVGSSSFSGQSLKAFFKLN